MKAGFLTLGCRVNQYETEALAEELFRIGFERGDFGGKCDIYIINTCAVTEESVRKSRQMVRRAIKNNPDAFVGVMGCASQLDGEAFAAIPGVSFVCGTRNRAEILRAAEMFSRAGDRRRASLTLFLRRGSLQRPLPSALSGRGLMSRSRTGATEDAATASFRRSAEVL